jgi:hypothetical protein
MDLPVKARETIRRMRRDNSNNNAEFANITDTRNEDASGETSRPSDRVILLNTFKEFVRMGEATLEELPGLESPLLHLAIWQSLWLRPQDIMRIQ